MSRVCILLTFILTLAVCAPAARAADAPASEAYLRKEALGGLHLTQSGKDVIKLLGQPEKQGPVSRQEADGAFVQTWNYPSKGLEITMASENAKGRNQSVAAILAKSPCTLATHQGIQIGSPESAARKAYAAHADRETPAEPGTFVVGSVYGGIIFQFAHGKVSRIFFGAAAE